MLAKAKKEILDPHGKHVGWMIAEAWSQLQMMRKKWPDAACLVVCQPGTKHGAETKMIHGVAKRIADLTGWVPPVVTSDDKASHGRINHFRNNTDPFLCAVRMVSEGVDIPRLRMVLFLSYTDSEMLFRQIVGRCIRYIAGQEDDTAACVVYPRFPVMSDFAERFEQESLAGKVLLEPRPEIHQTDEADGGVGEKQCTQCGCSPCECYEIIGSDHGANGGQIGGENVQERFIRRAKVICDSSSTHQHANVVQLADVLQRDAALGELPLDINLEDCKELAIRNIRNAVERIARRLYAGDLSAAYRCELHQLHDVDSLETIRSTWRLEQIEQLAGLLRQRLREVLIHG
jgi:hypothetical protein